MVRNTAGDTPPEEAMSLCHVFGCRTSDRKGNLVILLTGEVAYYTARAVIISDVTNRRQRLFTGHHTCDIIALALHPDGLTIASSDMNGFVVIWDAISLRVRARLSPGGGERAVGLSFTPDGRFLSTVGSDELHTLRMWVWDPPPGEGGPYMLACHGTERGVPGSVLCNARITDKSSIEVCCCGDSYIYFYRLWNGKLHKDSSVRADPSGSGDPGDARVRWWRLVRSEGSVPRSRIGRGRGRRRMLTCLEYVAYDEVMAGSDDGSVLLYKGDNLLRIIDPPGGEGGSAFINGGVYSLTGCFDRGLAVTGGGRGGSQDAVEGVGAGGGGMGNSDCCRTCRVDRGGPSCFRG